MKTALLGTVWQGISSHGGFVGFFSFQPLPFPRRVGIIMRTDDIQTEKRIFYGIPCE